MKRDSSSSNDNRRLSKNAKIADNILQTFLGKYHDRLDWLFVETTTLDIRAILDSENQDEDYRGYWIARSLARIAFHGHFTHQEKKQAAKRVCEILPSLKKHLLDSEIIPEMPRLPKSTLFPDENPPF